MSRCTPVSVLRMRFFNLHAYEMYCRENTCKVSSRLGEHIVPRLYAWETVICRQIGRVRSGPSAESDLSCATVRRNSMLQHQRRQPEMVYCGRQEAMYLVSLGPGYPRYDQIRWRSAVYRRSRGKASASGRGLLPFHG